MIIHQELGIEAYKQLLERVHRQVLVAEDTTKEANNQIRELEAQQLWVSGQLGRAGETVQHGSLRIIDFGEWNRSAGPDFLRAEIELNGSRIRGDIELDPKAQDWERHGHGSNPMFDGVILHVVLSPSPKGWYTRDSRHRNIPIFEIPQDTLQIALGASQPADITTLDLCRTPLAEMPLERINTLLQAGAAFRALRKRRLFLSKAECVGQQQAWFEALAETLGYHANKRAMLILAHRAPLRDLRSQAESILFGTAGFLQPLLPEHTSLEARCYHRSIWDSWWPLSNTFGLDKERSIPWQFAPLRPQNHPHRRVAALAIAASRWKEIEPHLNIEDAAVLAKLLTSLRHPYWDYHCSLPSTDSPRRMALIGSERVQDFLINHVYAYNPSNAAWCSYLKLKTKQKSHTIVRTASRLFGDRRDLGDLLQYCYAQQGILQIQADFCASNTCTDCQFPKQLAQWQLLKHPS